MRWFRRYFSLLVPLLALLIGIESIMLINRAVASYEKIANKNYAIIIVSDSVLDMGIIKNKITDLQSLNELDSSAILSEINSSFANSSISDIQASLPRFYSLRLNTFPNAYKIKQIENELLKIENITRVESFSRSHTQIYRMLVLLKGCVLLLSGLIFVLSFLLMMKQIEVWRFEHSERMEIMTYLGAPSKFKNAPLYRLAIIDSLLASLFVVVSVIFLSKNTRIGSIVGMLEIDIFNIRLFALDYVILLLSAYAISIISVFIVILSQKEP